MIREAGCTEKVLEALLYEHGTLLVELYMLISRSQWRDAKIGV